jgi:hypothetical protein
LHKQPNREKILSCLIYIKSSSQDWKRCHNLILKCEAGLCDSKIDATYLGAAFKVTEEPEYFSPSLDRVAKNIIFCIELTDEPPYNCYLLTAPEKEAEYKNNKHFQGINNMKIISGDMALNVINSFFRAFTSARESLPR